MNNLKSLKFMINFIYYGFLFAAFLWIMLHVFNPGGSIESLLKAISQSGFEGNVNKGNELNLIALVPNLVRVALFFYILFLLKRVVKNFEVGKIFSQITRESFRKIGIATVCYGIVFMMMNIFVPYFTSGGYTIFPIGFSGFESAYFVIALGLLFIYIASVLKEGEFVMEENKLTI